MTISSGVVTLRSRSKLWLKVEAIAKAREAAAALEPVPLRGPAFHRERHKELVWDRRMRLAAAAFIQMALARAADAKAEAALAITHESAMQIVAEVASKYGLSYRDLIGPRRTRKFILPRHEAMYRVAVERPNMSFPMIGRVFRRDHTTVLKALQQHVKRNPELLPARPPP